MTERQLPLMTKVIDIKQARKNQKGQQALFETEERYLPYSMVAESLSNINESFCAQQTVLTDKVDRLTNTLETLVPQFEMGISGKQPHIYVGNLKPGQKADLALAESPLPAEICYPYNTSDLAQLINMYPSRLGTLLKKAGIQGDEQFHSEFKTGAKSKTQRYKMSALTELYQRIHDGNCPSIKPEELAKLENYLKMREIEA
jgi:hypothetical protein